MEQFILSRVRPEYYNSIAGFKKEIFEGDRKFDGCQQLDLYDDIEKWDLNCKLFEDPSTVPPGYSLGYQYLYLDKEDVVGMINLRPLAEMHVFLSRFGGAIGYSVRPSRRRQGIATRMLSDMLKICRKDFRMNRVLITCLEDNVASRKVILNNGGVFENKILYPPEDRYVERYWIKL